MPCEYGRTYDAFVPCPEELANNLAEDYANQRHWCDFTEDGNGSEIPVSKCVEIGGSAWMLKLLGTVCSLLCMSWVVLCLLCCGGCIQTLAPPFASPTDLPTNLSIHLITQVLVKVDAGAGKVRA